MRTSRPDRSIRAFRSVHLPALVPLLILAASPQEGGSTESIQALPEGRSGIAAQHPADRGIEKDERVLFVERFDEKSLTALFERWESVKNGEGMSFSADAPTGSGDDRSLRMRHVGGQGTGCHLYRRLPPGHDKVFARFYVKFGETCAPIHHFGTHLGGFSPSTPWPQGGAGVRPDGAKRFTSGVEPYGGDWRWDFYTYWQGMRVHGDGNYWGTPFLSGAKRPAVEKNEWVCVEIMLVMNDPVEESNGEQAFWIDGELWRLDGQVVSHAGRGFPKGRWRGGWWSPDPTAETSFEGFQWRTREELAINYLWTYLYITKAPEGHVSEVWFDDIVVATEYIGPIEPKRTDEAKEEGDSP